MADWEHLTFLAVSVIHLILNVHGLVQPIPATSDKLVDKELMRVMEENGYNGASLGVLQDEKLVYMKGHGETSAGDTIPISSLSELLTAAAVMRLVEEDRVGLQDQVFGPDGVLGFPAAVDMQLYDPRILDVTVLHLLHHTAGWKSTKSSTKFHLPSSLHLSSNPNDSRSAADVSVLADQLVQVVQPTSLDLTSDPGTKFHLSDKDELLLRKVIETISGQNYKDFVSEQVLEPLGMWATELRPGQASKSQKKHLFEEGEILVDRHTGELIPTPETWYSTIPDLLHLVQAVGHQAPSRLHKTETVKRMLEKPELPMPQHVEMWHGAGMQVNNNGTWWKGGGSEGVYVMAFCDGQHRLTRNQQIVLYGHTDGPVKQGVCWVICLHGNNPISPPVRRQLANMIHTCTSEMPEKDLFIQGYTDMVTELKSGKMVALKHGIPDNHMKAYLNGVHSLGYEVQWVSAYNVQNKAHFAVVLRKGKITKNGTSQEVGLYPSKKQLSKGVSELETKGYHVDFLTSYTSEPCRKVCHVVTFVHKPTRELQQTKVRWEKTLDKYEDDRRDKITAGYVISMQSVISVHDQFYLSYVLEKQNDVSKTAVYTGLTLPELQTAIHTNGLGEKTLAHLDPYSTTDGIRFSAVFNTNRFGKWTFHGKLTKELLEQEMGRSTRLGYEPSIFVGYEDEGNIYYAVMWILY
ncbi:uncharacterized protein [Branchiostoma lanceolatum]|uniref:uncharacterized protein n=1 Tax=Branchiostoma lanceolatum TaxID=7740 RepID=UPI0034548651